MQTNFVTPRLFWPIRNGLNQSEFYFIFNQGHGLSIWEHYLFISCSEFAVFPLKTCPFSQKDDTCLLSSSVKRTHRQRQWRFHWSKYVAFYWLINSDWVISQKSKREHESVSRRFASSQVWVRGDGLKLKHGIFEQGTVYKQKILSRNRANIHTSRGYLRQTEFFKDVCLFVLQNKNLKWINTACNLKDHTVD